MRTRRKYEKNAKNMLIKSLVLILLMTQFQAIKKWRRKRLHGHQKNERRIA